MAIPEWLLSVVPKLGLSCDSHAINSIWVLPANHSKDLWMSTARLRTFLAVARHASFSAGARAIGLSQPTATNQVQGLEREFNVELFHRRGRRIELTAVGRALLPIAQRMWMLEAEATSLLRDSGQLNRGAEDRCGGAVPCDRDGRPLPAGVSTDRRVDSRGQLGVGAGRSSGLRDRYRRVGRAA